MPSHGLGSYRTGVRLCMILLGDTDIDRCEITVLYGEDGKIWELTAFLPGVRIYHFFLSFWSVKSLGDGDTGSSSS